jgi:tetratricopeptide (TPR) repeat protein
MFLRRNSILFAALLCIALFLQNGCAPKAPPSGEKPQDFSSLFQVDKKIHATIGVYVSKDVREYVLKRNMMGMDFQIEIGKSIAPISMQMCRAMFDAAVEVDSLPPYSGGQASGVEAVLEPEILYADAGAEGTVSAQAEVKVKFRMKVYDLNGKVIWETSGLGSKRSDRLGFLTLFDARRDKVREVGLQACILAAQEITRDFKSNRPARLVALQEIEAPAQEGVPKGTSPLQLADKLYQKGLREFDQKNYQYALMAFQEGEKLNPEDLFIKFYVGICRVYAGQRSAAIEGLSYILAQPRSAGILAVDSKRWMQRLNDPLKICIVYGGSDESFPGALRSRYTQALAGCGMYQIVDVQKDTAVGSPMDAAALKKILADGDKKKAKAVIVVKGLSYERAVENPGLQGGDQATEFELTTEVKAYGTKTGKTASSFLLTDTHALMSKDAELEKGEIYGALAQRNRARMVLSLLGDEIF